MKTWNSGLSQGGPDANREFTIHRLRGGVLLPNLCRRRRQQTTRRASWDGLFEPQETRRATSKPGFSQRIIADCGSQ
jgi:hypothetical protein